MDQVNLAAKLATFGDHWQPRTIARFNDCDIMVVKAQGEFVWHKHDDTDDFFLVLDGLGQTTGAILLVAGMSSEKQVLIRNDMARAPKNDFTFRVSPARFSTGSFGLAMSGAF